MKVLERFLNYVAYPTTSSDTSGTTPSTAGQRVLAEHIAEELRAIGLDNAHVDEWGYVYAHLGSNTDSPANSVALIAHMDTSSEASGEGIKPRVIEYSGGDILLNPEEGILMRVDDYPYLEDFVGQRLVVTDGKTLLGADDKAGIAEIVTAVERIISEGLPHGDVYICFTPDEEIGEGADHINMDKLPADYGYTVDGGTLGEVEYENFNAASARFTFHGVSIHPGSAKNRMKNAIRIAAELNSALPEDELPELTEGYEGFHHLLSMKGECEEAVSSYIIRDHDMTLFEKKKEVFRKVTEEFNRLYGEGTVELTLTDSYYNMKEKIDPNPFIPDRAKRAMENCGVTPTVTPIRGGTDGARLSFMGLPCPNLSTGGVNFHSRFEFLSVDAAEKMTEVLVSLVTSLPKEEKLKVVK